MLHPLEGIEERLKRANENIRNLDLEISRFLNEKGPRELVEQDPKRIDAFKEFWSKPSIPPRFAALISEILHGYRAALDNLIWGLLRQAGYTPRNPNVIEFPIFSARPATPEKRSLFNRKIEGVGDQASAVIESLQPYNAVSQWHGPHHALLILHDMNRFDKHRELTIVSSQSQQTPQIYLVLASLVGKDPKTGGEIRRPVGQPGSVHRDEAHRGRSIPPIW